MNQYDAADPDHAFEACESHGVEGELLKYRESTYRPGALRHLAKTGLLAEELLREVFSATDVAHAHRRRLERNRPRP